MTGAFCAISTIYCFTWGGCVKINLALTRLDCFLNLSLMKSWRSTFPPPMESLYFVRSNPRPEKASLPQQRSPGHTNTFRQVLPAREACLFLSIIFILSATEISTKLFIALQLKVPSFPFISHKILFNRSQDITYDQLWLNRLYDLIEFTKIVWRL